MAPRSTSLEECYEVARAEAHRYQELINKLPNDPQHHRDMDILTAKRNAASRIARLIRHGKTVVHEQEDQEQRQKQARYPMKPRNLHYENER